MTGEIKPCPFCGADAVEMESPFPHDHAYCVRCPNCCFGSIRASEDSVSDAKSAAIAAWNTRTPPPGETARAGDGEITQADRDFAAKVAKYFKGLTFSEEVSNGLHDFSALVLACADHRTTMQRERDEAREMLAEAAVALRELREVAELHPVASPNQAYVTISVSLDDIHEIDAFLARYEVK